MKRRHLQESLVKELKDGKISLPLLSRYAEVFDVPLSNMFQIIVTGREDLKVKQEKTNNPLVVVTKIEEKEK